MGKKMDKRVCLLDTNIIYLLAEIETNNYDMEKIKKLCLENDCLIDLYSIFEIYNNSHLSLEQRIAIVDTLKDKKIKVNCNFLTSSIFKDDFNINLIAQEDRNNIKNKLSMEIMPIYSDFFSKLAIVNFFILFLLNPNANDEYFKELKLFMKKLLPVLNEHLKIVLEKICYENNFFEKKLKKLYQSFVSSFFFTILNFNENYFKNKSSADFSEYFERLLQEFKRKDFMDCNICFVMEGSYKQNNLILPNMYKFQFKQKYSTKADADCLFDDLANIICGKEEKLEKEWFKYMIKNLLYDEAFLKSNNFIDFLIIKDFTLNHKVNYLITCDKEMQKIMKVLSFNNKIGDSIKIIKTLE